VLELNNSEWQPARWRRDPIGAGGRWPLVLLNGLLSLGIGVILLAWPRGSVALLGLLFVTTLLANGMVLMAIALTDRETAIGRRWLIGVVGALSWAVAVIGLLEPAGSLRVIAWLVGVWLTLSGVLAILGALTDSAEGGRGWAGARGMLSVSGGLVVLLQPEITLLVLGITFGLVLVALGVLLVVDAVRLRARAL
jgi:uncharacterized membrane protein HdeD (DUF308 family)